MLVTKEISLEKEGAVEIYERLRLLNEDFQAIPIQEVAEEHRTAFAHWRQTFGSTVLWFGNFSHYKDYSSSVNAAMALGKFGVTLYPSTELINQETQDEIAATGAAMWDCIQANAGRIVPFS